MNIRKGTLIAAFMLLTCTAASEPYSYEVGVNYMQTETDVVDKDSTGITGTWFWQGVGSTDFPLAEAAFVGRASSVSIGYEERNVDLTPVFTTLRFSGMPMLNLPDITVDNVSTLPVAGGINIVGNAFPIQPAFLGFSGEEADIVSLATRYVSQNGWIGGLSYSQAKDDSSFESLTTRLSVNQQVDTVLLTIGKYFGTATSVTFEYKDVSDESMLQQIRSSSVVTPFPGLPVFFFGNQRTEADFSVGGYTLAAKTLIRRNDYTHKLQAEIGYDELENTFASFFTINGDVTAPAPFKNKSYVKRFGMSYAIYPRRDLEFGIGYSLTDPEVGKLNSFSLSAEWFVTPKIALRAAIISANADQSFADQNGFSVAATGRF